MDVGARSAIPASWLVAIDGQGLAVGVISTSNGPGPEFGASWDFLDVYLLAGNAPVIDPIADLSIGEGATQSVIADIADIDGDTVTVEVTSVPDGSSFITDTLVENGAGDYTLTLDLAPLAGDAGVYDVTITANDGANPDVVETFELTVVEPGAAPTVLYRVNAGGVAEAAADASLPAWGTDTNAVPSPYRVANGGGANTYAGSAGNAHPGPIVMTDPSRPAGAPAAVFDIERWDPPAAPRCCREFPIDSGTTQVEVNLLFAELFSGVTAAGQRVFDVAVEGTVPTEFDDVDPFGTAGAKGAFALSTTVAVTDGTLNIDFLHDVIENPAIKGIEILDVTPANDPPTVDPIADQTVAENDPFSLQVVALDTDPLSYALSGDVPAGMTVDAAGLIEFTPDWDDSGSYDLVVEVDDGTNPAVTEAFTLAVTQTDAGTVLRRINVGGPTPDVVASDAGPDWSANPNPNTLTELTGGGNNGVPILRWQWRPGDRHRRSDRPGFHADRRVPVRALGPGAAPEMTWNFAATPGSLVEVRIGHAEIFNGVTAAGAREYDILIDGVLVGDDIDPYGTVGAAAGFVTDHVIIADGDGVDIEFVHVTDNPNPKSIEIIELVPAPNVAPTVDSFVPAGPVVVNQGAAIPTITVNASDLNGDTIAPTSDGGEPTGVTFADLGGGGRRAAPEPANDAPGTYTVTVTATDPSLAAGTGTVDIEIVINDPPTIDPIADQTVAEQTPFSLGVVANDTEALSYALSGDVPTGMTIDPTGLIGWTPGLADSGRYAITVEVDDGTNPPTTESFTLDVTQTAPPGSAIHRVNVGGPAVAAADASYPDWSADTGADPSPFRTAGSNNIFGPGVGISDLTHPTVTGTAPQAVYEQERYDTTGGDEMTWALPVDAGTEVELRLYFAELFNGITAPGQRLIDVEIDGTVVETGIDPYAEGGGTGAAVVHDYLVTSDGTIDIRLLHNVENPALKGIEILGVSGVPSVTMTSPADGATINDDQVMVSWDLNGFLDPNDHVHVTLDGIQPHTSVFRPDTSLDLTSLADGPHTVTLQVADVGHTLYTNPEAFDEADFTVNAVQAPLAVDHATYGDPLYRVNAGGGPVAAVDGGPDWEADDLSYLENAYATQDAAELKTSGGATITPDSSVPASVPNGVFTTERWDPSTGLEMGWEFPVDVGTPVEVRLLFGESCNCANDPGERVFDVTVDGVLTLDDYDIMADADVPFQAGTMKAFRVVSDGVIDLDFTHVVENTEIRAIEIVELVDTATVPAGDVDFLTVVSNPGTNGQAASLTDVVDSLNGPGLPGTPTSIAASCDLAIPGDLAPGTSTECRFTRTINGNPAEVFSDVVDVAGVFTGGQDAVVMSGAVTITMTSLPPGAPAGLGAIDGDGVVDLDWTDTAGATGYNVYRGTAPGVTAAGGTLLTGTPATTSDFSDTTAVNGTIYHYIVTAVGAGGEGAESAEVSGHPLPNTAVIERINAGAGSSPQQTACRTGRRTVRGRPTIPGSACRAPTTSARSRSPGVTRPSPRTCHKDCSRPNGTTGRSGLLT